MFSQRYIVQNMEKIAGGGEVGMEETVAQSFMSFPFYNCCFLSKVEKCGKISFAASHVLKQR